MADPRLAGSANADFHLTKDSPRIDAGLNSAPALPVTDIDGNDRKIDDPKVVNTGLTSRKVDGSYKLSLGAKVHTVGNYLTLGRFPSVQVSRQYFDLMQKIKRPSLCDSALVINEMSTFRDSNNQ